MLGRGILLRYQGLRRWLSPRIPYYFLGRLLRICEESPKNLKVARVPWETQGFLMPLRLLYIDASGPFDTRRVGGLSIIVSILASIILSIPSKHYIKVSIILNILVSLIVSIILNILVSLIVSIFVSITSMTVITIVSTAVSIFVSIMSMTVSTQVSIVIIIHPPKKLNYSIILSIILSIISRILSIISRILSIISRILSIINII